MRLPLTSKQKNFYQILCAFTDHGNKPTYKELAEIYGCNSTSTIYKLMQQLKNRGWIQFIPGSNKEGIMIE
jgi:MarR-like DNA-binding transcriptional regulator SgrR of sgrS sRNA